MNFFQGRLDGSTFQTDTHQFDLSDYSFTQPATGPVWLGIRPEHVLTGLAADASPNQMQAIVTLVEPLGSDTLVQAKVAGQSLWLRMDGQAAVRSGDQLTIGFNATLANLFDATTDTRL
jgi:multiple sugar transport system ATP-binding protein